MIFVRYESFRQYVRLYPVNVLILAINFILFILLMFSGGAGQTDVLLRYGALTNVDGYDQFWRYATALFLHAGWSHLVFNMFAIFVFAPPLERIFGHVRYAFFYLMAGILGNVVAVALASGEWIGVGASTAIYGVYGAYLYISLFQRNKLDQGSRTTVFGILAIGLIYSLIIPNVGYWAHFGGLAAGFVLYGLMGSRYLSR